ncbi:MAG: hypothetical protein WAK21_00015 [Candidatus Sulfotelmatobacter sp.]
MRTFPMLQPDEITSEARTIERTAAAKKPYQEPAFRHERVFETMALSCGKVDPTQLQCHYNRQAS